MKKTYLILSSLLILSSCSNNKTPESDLEAVSYSLGVTFGSTVKSQGLDNIDINSLSNGFNDILSENNLHISEDSSLKVIQNYFEQLSKEKSIISAKEEKNYLEENAQKDGVFTMKKIIVLLLMKLTLKEFYIYRRKHLQVYCYCYILKALFHLPRRLFQ